MCCFAGNIYVVVDNVLCEKKLSTLLIVNVIDSIEAGSRHPAALSNTFNFHAGILKRVVDNIVTEFRIS